MVAHHSREVLVIHPGALGDVAQAVPALTALRAPEDGTRLTFAGQWRLGGLLAGAGLVDEALPFDGLRLEALFAGASVPPSLQSRLARFDRVISWFGARAESFRERLRGVVRDALIAPPVPETGPPPTVWEHLLNTLAPWGVTVPTRLPPLGLPDAWRAEARRTLMWLGADGPRPLLVVHPGAGGEWKRWPAERFGRVIRRVALETECQVLCHQGPADKDAVDELSGALDLPLLFLIEPPLYLLAGVLQEAEAYLGGDSGVSHLAAAVGAPAVILFPAATRDRWAPWSATALPLALSGDVHEVETLARAVSERLATPDRRLAALAAAERKESTDSSRHQDELAELLSLGQNSLGLHPILEREDAVHHGLEGPPEELSHHLVELPAICHGRADDL